MIKSCAIYDFAACILGSWYEDKTWQNYTYDIAYQLLNNIISSLTTTKFPLNWDGICLPNLCYNYIMRTPESFRFDESRFKKAIDNISK